MQCPFCGKEIRQGISEKNRRKRREFVLNNIPVDEINFEKFYQSMRKKGYELNRKTLKRDINFLYDIGEIYKSVNIGGSSGSYSLIKRKYEIQI